MILSLRKFFKNPLISLSLLILSLLGLLLYMLSCIQVVKEYEERELRIQRLEVKEKKHELFKAKVEEFHNGLNSSDPNFIQKNIETLSFLDLEKKRIEQLSLTQPHMDLHKAKEYLSHNKLQLNEEVLSKRGIYKESLLTENQSLLVNDEDVKKLLCLIEGTTIFPYAPAKGRPQLVIKSFQLQKKSFAPYQNVYSLDIKIFKREKASNDKKISTQR